MSTDASHPAHEGALETLPTSEVGWTIQPLAQRSMFWRPAYLEQSSWHEHIPFAFWLVEAHRPRTFVELGTHWGVSYFAFCQAVEKLLLETRCYAVDPWDALGEATERDESVFDKVRAYNDSQYSGFSELVRASFDEALGSFTDGTIDLLHFHGQHSFDAVAHDFESWLPKLSERGLLVLHDTNVRERGSGVFKLLERLRSEFPTFEFVHGRGLGVVGVGRSQGDMIRSLLQARESESATRAIREIFSRLGRACADSFAASRQNERTRALLTEVGTYTKAVEELRGRLAQADAENDRASKEITEHKLKLQAESERHAAERGQLLERVKLLQELRAEDKEEIARLRSEAEAARAAPREAHGGAPPTAELSQMLSTLSADRDRARDELATARAELSALRASLDEANARAQEARGAGAASGKLVAERASELEAQSEELRRETQRLAAALEERFREIAALTRMLEEKEDAVSDLRTRLDDYKRRLAALRASGEADAARFAAEKRALEQSLQDRSKEKAAVARALEQKDALLGERDGQLRGVKEQLSKLAAQNKALAAERAREQAEASALLEAAKAEAATHAAQATELAATREELSVQLAAKQGEVAALRRRISKLKKTTSWRMTAPMRALARGLGSVTSPALSVGRQVELVRESGLVDGPWYQEQYPDVAAGGADPVEHYVRYGAAEGRDPSPTFSTGTYLAAHPDLASRGINPLVHYLQHRPEGAVEPGLGAVGGQSPSASGGAAHRLRRLADRLVDRARPDR